MSGLHVSNMAGRKVPIVRRYVGNAVLRDAVFDRYILLGLENLRSIHVNNQTVLKFRTRCGRYYRCSAGDGCYPR